MSPTTTRRALHHAHWITTLLLIATGLLMTLPDLRARLIGGYGRQIADIHLWVGWAYLAAPALALALAPRPLLRDLRRRLGPPGPRLAWRKLHIVFTLASGVILALTGVILWLDSGLPLALLDALSTTHLWLTWALVGLVPIHVALGWRKTVQRTLEILGRAPEPPFPFDLEDDSGATGE